MELRCRQHWLWYAYNTKTGGVLAYTFGLRTDQTCRELLALLTPFNIGMLTSDDWGSYGRVVPKNKHLTGKIFTQRIERNNLTLRTHIKRLARKQSASHAQLRSTKKWSERLSKNTCSTNWMHYQILNRGYISLHFSFINPVFFTESIYQYPVHTLLKKIIYTEWVIMRLIYHNICCPHRSGRVRHKRGGSQVKPATNHPIHRPVRDR